MKGLYIVDNLNLIIHLGERIFPLLVYCFYLEGKTSPFFNGEVSILLEFNLYNFLAHVSTCYSMLSSLLR